MGLKLREITSLTQSCQHTHTALRSDVWHGARLDGQGQLVDSSPLVLLHQFRLQGAAHQRQILKYQREAQHYAHLQIQHLAGNPLFLLKQGANYPPRTTINPLKTICIFHNKSRRQRKKRQKYLVTNIANRQKIPSVVKSRNVNFRSGCNFW